MDRATGEFRGYGEQKYNEQTPLPANYGDTQHLVYNPVDRATPVHDHYSADVYRGMLGDVDMQQKQMSAFQFPDTGVSYAANGKTWAGATGGKTAGFVDTYDGGIVRADVGTQHRNQWGSASIGHLDGPLEMQPGSRLVHNTKYPIQMASPDQYRKQQYDEVLFVNEDIDDEASEDSMMMEDEAMGYDAAPGSFSPPPEYYRRDSTLKSVVSAPETVDAIERALADKSRSVDYTQINCSQFEGQCCEGGRCCDFMINTYQDSQQDGNDTREQIWVEFRNLSSGINSKQAFAVFFRDMVATLSRWSITDGLVNPDFQMITSFQEETGGEDEPSSVADEEVRRVIQDRVRELQQASFFGKQRALSEEILFIAERHASLVAESPELAPVLLDILGKNAKSDTQMSTTILRLVRGLLAHERFGQGLKEACHSFTDNRADAMLIKILLQTAVATENRTWQADLFSTVLALQKVGFKCTGKKANAAYHRIKDATNMHEICM